MTEYYPEPGATPHRCPVCLGTGLVPNGFYTAIGVSVYGTSSTAPETCRSCHGAGIVWSFKAQVEESDSQPGE